MAASTSLVFVKNHIIASLIKMVALVLILGMMSATAYVYRRSAYKEGEYEELYRIFNMWVIILILVFKNFGSVFRPKWQVSLYFSSLFFTVARSAIIYCSYDDRSMSEMFMTVVFSTAVAIVCNCLAYTVRWVLVRSFIF
jgi:hypothetical protein